MVSPVVAPKDFDLLLADTRYCGLLIGPGAGCDAVTRSRVLAMLATGRPTVLDADALTVFKDAPATLLKAITGPCVLTPYAGEFARLFTVTGDKLADTRNAAIGSGAVIVYKGRDTIIATPSAPSPGANFPHSLKGKT